MRVAQRAEQVPHFTFRFTGWVQKKKSANTNPKGAALLGVCEQHTRSACEAARAGAQHTDGVVLAYRQSGAERAALGGIRGCHGAQSGPPIREGQARGSADVC
jgi:hypothetical protein